MGPELGESILIGPWEWVGMLSMIGGPFYAKRTAKNGKHNNMKWKEETPVQERQTIWSCC